MFEFCSKIRRSATKRRFGSFFALLLASCATSQPFGPAPDRQATADDCASSTAELDAWFAPRPDGRSGPIDYGDADIILDGIVLETGPSLRMREGRPDVFTGSRIIRGHTSALRLEGNKIAYSRFDNEIRAGIASYRAALEDVAASGRVQSLPKDEQLAFWMNLHNFVVIDEIARAYPVRKPSAIKTGPERALLHDAKIIDLGAFTVSPLQLRRLVYQHWEGPNVPYGFYRGDIGGPNIRGRAFTGGALDAMLDGNAREFVNSLRGVRTAGTELEVSRLYAEGCGAHSYENADRLRTHLLRYANDDVAGEIVQTAALSWSQYEDDIGDLAGGYHSFGPALPSQTISGNGHIVHTGPLPLGMRNMIREFEEKQRRLLDLRMRDAEVTIIDGSMNDADDEARDER